MIDVCKDMLQKIEPLGLTKKFFSLIMSMSAVEPPTPTRLLKRYEVNKMANRNRVATIKAMVENNVQGQIITGKNPDNVVAVIVGGYKFDRLANTTRDELDALMASIACDLKEAYTAHVERRSSCAKQKINEAHGRSYRERAIHHDTQEMTYADRFQNIQFVGQTISHVLWQYVVEDTGCSIESIREWEVDDDNFIKINQTYYNIENMFEVIDKWLEVNHKGCTKDAKLEIVKTFEKLMNRDLQAV